MNSRRVARTLSVIAVVGALLGLAACSSSTVDKAKALEPSSSAAADPGAQCGVHMVGAVQVRTFCGSGKSSLTSAKSTMNLSKASCESTKNYLAVNAGTIVLGFDSAAKALKARSQYIGLTVGRIPGTTDKAATGDGTYTGGVLGVNDKGTAVLPNPKTLKVTLTGNRTAGTWSGSLIGGGSVSGSFTCS